MTVVSYMIWKAQATKEKITWIELHQNLKILCFKGHYQENEKKPTHRMDRISANHICDKGLVSRTYKQCLWLNNKKIAQLKNTKNLNGQFFNKHKKDV